MSFMFNTKGARYGFVAKYADGTMLSEFDHLWDSIPSDKPIQSLMVWDNDNSVALVELVGYDRFFFSNEATFGAGMDPIMGRMNIGQGALTAKIIGGVNDGVGVDEIRIDLTSDVPKGSKRQYHSGACTFAPHAMRPGMGRAF